MGHSPGSFFRSPHSLIRRWLPFRAARDDTRSLNRRLWLGAGTIILLTLALAAHPMTRAYSDLVVAQRNLRHLAYYRLVLETANLLSAERGPTNSILGEEPAIDSPSRRKLARYRSASDAALGRLAAPPPEIGVDQTVSTDLLARVWERLALGRLEVDRLAALPLADRPRVDIQRAIEGMFEVVDVFQIAVRWDAKEIASVKMV